MKVHLLDSYTFIIFFNFLIFIQTIIDDEEQFKRGQQNINQIFTTRMSDHQTNGKYVVDQLNNKAEQSIGKELSKNGSPSIQVSQNQANQNRIKNGKATQHSNNSNQGEAQIDRSPGKIQDDLAVLKHQIDQLESIEKYETKLRYQSEAYVCKKRRSNLLRAFQKKIERPLKVYSNSKGIAFDIFFKNQMPFNKSVHKIQKFLRNFRGRPELKDANTMNIMEIYRDKKLGSQANKIADNLYGYKQEDFRKIRKYKLNLSSHPSLGYNFKEEQGIDQQISKNQMLETYDDQVNYFDQIPKNLNGYIVPFNLNLQKLFLDNRRPIFKMARSLNRMKIQKERTLKRIAYLAVKEVQRRYLKSIRDQNQYINRAKKLQRESMVYWRKRAKQLIQIKKKQQKLEAQLKKRDEQDQQNARQQKRLDYIMYQSAIYSHFMSKRLTGGQQGKKQFKPEDSEGLFQNITIDKEAANLAVDQIINNKAYNLTKFQKDGDKLDLSMVQQGGNELIGPPPTFKGTLKQYQVKGLRWLNNLFQQGINGILADEMGLGKTIQAIALLSHISFVKNIWGPFLIVAPNSTLFNWQQQFKKFCPSLRVLPYWGSLKQRKTIRKFFSEKKFTQKADSPFHVVITSYQLTVTDDKAFKRLKWQFMILDEAQAIKNVLSQRWTTLKQFQARNRLLLTGTPIQNNMAELWALLNFIMPELFDSHQLFNEWFSKDIEAHSQDQKSLDKIKIQRLHAILKPFMLRRVKKDVEHQIGKKIQHQILCEMTKRQKKLYDSIKQKLNLKDFFKMLENKAKVENLMNLVMQLRKVCNHPQLFERRPPKSPFLFQQLYYYTGYIPIKMGQEKLIAFNSNNPIQFSLAKLVYDDILKFKQSLHERNKRLCNIYAISNQIDNKNFSITRLMNLSYQKVQNCAKKDPIFVELLLMHWMKHNGYNSTTSIKSYINFINNTLPEQRYQKFLLPQWNYNHIINMYIPAATAPSIVPQISSATFYQDYGLISNNTFQKFIMEGKYQKYWRNLLPGQQQYQGLLPCRQQLTKLQVVDFGSLVADSAKLRELDRILKEKKKNGDRVLIFCQMTKMLDILQDFMNMRKYTFFRLDGACNLADRRDMVNEFQVNNKIFVFLLSTRAGGLGVTLTAANAVIFYDNDWNPTMDAQATDRAHRIGQRNDVFVYQLVTKGTIQQRIVKRAEQKKTVQTTVYEGASFNLFKKDMIMDIINDEFNEGLQEDPKKKQGPPKKKGPKPKNKEDQKLEKNLKPQQSHQ